MKQAAPVGGLLAICCILAWGVPVRAQTTTQRLNWDVQRLWDDTFDPHRDGERAAWERHREAERHEWCHGHRDFDRCGPYR